MSTGSNLITLHWFGPFLYSEQGLQAGGDAPHWATKDDLERVSGGPGLYLFCVDHPIHGPRALAYIGRSGSIGGRLAKHDGWLRSEWGVEVYVAVCPEAQLTSVEELLIYAHSPIYNGQGVWNPPSVPKDLHIRNMGRFWGLYPDVCAAHPWHCK